MQPLVSSLSAGDCFVHRLTGAQNSHLQRETIPEAAHIQLRRGPPDDEQGKCSKHVEEFNPLNAELNPICYLLALLGAHHFLHVSRIRVNKCIICE